MKFRPTPKQALVLWSMIAGESDDVREPLQSEASPKLSKIEREPLFREGFVTLKKQGSGGRLELTNKAWAWAAETVDVELLVSNSRVGATALQGLLRRVLPFLKQRNIGLAELFIVSGEKPRAVKRPRANVAPAKGRGVPIDKQIEQACLALAHGSRKARVRLAALREHLSVVKPAILNAALLKLQDQGRLVLYRDDNTAALTDDDHRAALSVGGAPRHLVYLEA
jgi:hypothetical protein